MKTAARFSNPEAALKEGAKPLTINSLNISMVVKALTSMYPLAGFSAFREYFTNAIEASRLAGSPRPVEVTLPTAYNNYTLTIKDYGVGMSEEKIDTVYRQYNASTKSDSNEFIGGFGLGSKTGIAYTTRFDVTTIHNGMKNVFYISRVDDNGKPTLPHLQEVSNTPTNEPNGTTVTLVYKKDDFKEGYLLSVAGFPAEEYVITNKEFLNGTFNTLSSKSHYQVDGITGEPLGWVRHVNSKAYFGSPERKPASGYHLARPVNRYTAFVYVNVGGVLYTVPVSRIPSFSEKFVRFASTKHNNDYDKEIVLNIPVGSLDFISSRDDFDYTETTQTVISTIAEEFLNTLPGVLEEKLNELTTDDDIIGFARTWVPVVGMLSYRGNPVGVHWPAEAFTFPATGSVGYEGKRKVISALKDVTPKNSANVLYVKPSKKYVGVDALDKIKFYLAPISSIGYIKVIVVPEYVYNNPWFQKTATIVENISTVDELIEQAKEQRRKTQRSYSAKTDKTSSATIYSKITNEDGKVTVKPATLDDLAEEKIVYAFQHGAYAINIASYNTILSSTVKDYWAGLKGYVVIALTARQNEEVFLRKAPHAQPVEKIIFPLIEEEIKSISEWSLRVVLNNTRYSHHTFSSMYPMNIIAGYNLMVENGLPAIPELEEMKRVYDLPDLYSRFVGYHRNFVNKKLLDSAAEKWVPVLEKYYPFSLMVASDHQKKALEENKPYFNAASALLVELSK